MNSKLNNNNDDNDPRSYLNGSATASGSGVMNGDLGPCQPNDNENKDALREW